MGACERVRPPREGGGPRHPGFPACPPRGRVPRRQGLRDQDSRESGFRRHQQEGRRLPQGLRRRSQPSRSLSRAETNRRVSGKMLIANETELLARAVLRAANRAQAKGTPIRLVVPRALEVAYDLHMEVAEERLLAAEQG